MPKIPVVKVTLDELSPSNERSNQRGFFSIVAANRFIEAHPSTRFEFRVYWKDGTEQAGRVMGRRIEVWLSSWATRLLEKQEDPEVARTVKRMLEHDPKLADQARRLIHELSLS